jgi:RNA polymerase sigma-70 factor (ECF subfamily)
MVLSKAASALDDFRGDASPRTWLFRIATNAAHDWNRARRRRASELSGLEGEDDESVAGAEDASQERRLIREQMSQCIGDVLSRLPESYQTALALSDCEELSDREVAAILGVTVGTAKIRLHRARKKMKEELERACSFYHDAENTLCCDRKPNSADGAYRSDLASRQPIGSRNTDGGFEALNEEHIMTAVETLPSKSRHLIGVGAAIAAGCQPCTVSYVKAVQSAGACERGVRFALESGLAGREDALAAINDFANDTFASPELDASFRGERALLGALVRFAATFASNAAPLLSAQVKAARELGATDDQLRIAVQIARTVKRGAESEAEAALSSALGDAPAAETSSPCDCADGASNAKQPSAVSTPVAGGCGCGARSDAQ